MLFNEFLYEEFVMTIILSFDDYDVLFSFSETKHHLLPQII